ncbi:Low-affinity iron/zinc ion transport protein fet4 [Cokeromyces recurvatus]|uniref:Low-affinity iron/zinc ion transport protein fet4 n=1 Tax=Cokeromyces recurvatus TaxID=90255 RepID=UPI0022206C88|nr:Low-affinity iron/zinc ion transport protein fet4 [Cokeromyces recurvatus]KAI7907682.1 Low-affinity iron/zinc ion transport protein fet4 [Cokeromyces recurvatus]
MEPNIEKKPNVFKRFRNYLSSPGRQFAVQSAAPTQFLHKGNEETDCDINIVGSDLPHNISIYNEANKKSRGARFFDKVTDIAGSSFMFILTCIILIIWAIWGGVSKAPDEWQIVMQDGSSIQCYISDTLLMRQQQNHSNRLLTVIAQLRSRCITFDKLVKQTYEKHPKLTPYELKELAERMPEDTLGDATKLPTENFFDVCCNWASEAVGSLTSLLIYSAGVIAWVCIGDYLSWSDEWQLYINTAVAVELTFTSMFLQNTRRRHMQYLERCLECIHEIDINLEVLLRQTTGDNTPNPIVSIPPTPVSRGIRMIDYYGDVIGTGIGAFISLCVFIVWFGIGSPMGWSDNWWLIIGTYTGLVGFLDGFVLRNVYFRQDNVLDEQFDILTDSDKAIFQFLNLYLPEQNESPKQSFGQRLSARMGYICATPLAVLFAVLVIIGLICVASGMKWNVTGQLLCNSPTMIIEGFLLIVLLQAHNMSNTVRRVQMKDIFVRRVRLLHYIRMVTGANEHYDINEKHIQESTVVNEKKK